MLVCEYAYLIVRYDIEWSFGILRLIKLCGIVTVDAGRNIIVVAEVQYIHLFNGRLTTIVEHCQREIGKQLDECYE